MRLRREFFLREPQTVARDLLGKSLFFNEKRVVIVETEAYGNGDPASHAFRGKTPRNSPMFREGGWSYVYFIYGVHFCFNVATEGEGIPSAVLVRGGIPLSDLREIRKNRGRDETAGRILIGPGNFCKGLGIGRIENDRDLCSERNFYFYKGDVDPSGLEIEISDRVGITRGKEKPWRFILKNFDPGEIRSGR